MYDFLIIHSIVQESSVSFITWILRKSIFLVNMLNGFCGRCFVIPNLQVLFRRGLYFYHDTERQVLPDLLLLLASSSHNLF